jgi:hypothetical protein
LILIISQSLSRCFSSLIASFELLLLISLILFVFDLLKFSGLTLFKFTMAIHLYNPLFRMPTSWTEGHIVSMMWCMFILLVVLLGVLFKFVTSGRKYSRLLQTKDNIEVFLESRKAFVKWGSVRYHHLSQVWRQEDIMINLILLVYLFIVYQTLSFLSPIFIFLCSFVSLCPLIVYLII